MRRPVAVYKFNLPAGVIIGIAVNAMGLSVTGFMSYISRDPQAGIITSWNLGTFSAVEWWQVWIIIAVGVFSLLIASKFTRHLDALMPGESEATC